MLDQRVRRHKHLRAWCVSTHSVARASTMQAYVHAHPHARMQARRHPRAHARTHTRPHTSIWDVTGPPGAAAAATTAGHGLRAGLLPCSCLRTMLLLLLLLLLLLPLLLPRGGQHGGPRGKHLLLLPAVVLLQP